MKKVKEGPKLNGPQKIILSILGLLVLILAIIPSPKEEEEIVVVPVTIDKIGNKLNALTIANLVKEKLGKVNVNYDTYSSDLVLPNSELIYTRATITTKEGKSFVISYMMDTRPQESKNYLGDGLSIKDVSSGEEFTDPGIDGIPSFSDQQNKKARMLWTEKYQTVLKTVFSAMMGYSSP